MFCFYNSIFFVDENYKLKDIPEEIVNDSSVVAVDVNYIKNGQVLPIPENPTNGDMIKVMFRDAKLSFNEKLGEKGTVFMIFNNPETVLIFDMDWWDAQWKGERNADSN